MRLISIVNCTNIWTIFLDRSSNPCMVTVKSMMDVFALISGLYAGFGSFVVMYNMNPGITSFSLSPTTTCKKDKRHLRKYGSILSDNPQTTKKERSYRCYMAYWKMERDN